MKLKISQRARADTRAAAVWWRANRPRAPQLFDDELKRAFALIKAQPELGRAALDVPMAGVRRVFLRDTRYFVYYRLRFEQSFIEVLRIWHASRGSAPQL